MVRTKLYQTPYITLTISGTKPWETLEHKRPSIHLKTDVTRPRSLDSGNDLVQGIVELKSSRHRAKFSTNLQRQRLLETSKVGGHESTQSGNTNIVA